MRPASDSDAFCPWRGPSFFLKRPSSQSSAIDIINGKIWIQRDGAEQGVAPDWVRAGIPKESIVLAFRPPEVRKPTEYAVA